MDEGHNSTDRALIALERRIRAVYREAEGDTKRKFAEFTRKFKTKDAIYRTKLKKGEITEAQYRAWLAGQVFQGKQWRAKVEQMADSLVRADQMAQGIINDKVNDVFATNANWQSYHFEHEAGVDLSFGIYDSSTVARLLRDQPMLYPKKQVDIPKDKLWNQKLITRQITQGILQGEGLMDVAKRLQRVTDMDRSAAIRNARTGLTGAQNAGRQESMQRAVKMGIKTRKKWLATLDGHTRISHAYLDGKSVDVGEAFVYQGHKIRYPGDPEAVPSMVYNCRCTLIDDLVDYPDKSERRDNINGQLIKDMDYKEWLEAKKPKEKKKPERDVISILMNPNLFDDYDASVQGSVNAQVYEKIGIAGRPRLVDDFPKGSVVHYRGIGDSTSKTAEEYFEQLKYGKMYAKESTSGTGINFAKTGSKEGDIHLATSMIGGRGVIVEAVFDESANLVTYKDLQDLAEKFAESDIKKKLVEFARRTGEEKIEIGFAEGDRKSYAAGMAFQELASRLENNEKGLVGVLNGYDGVDSDMWTEYCIFNREKLIIKKKAIPVEP